jgi:hypothetical protein
MTDPAADPLVTFFEARLDQAERAVYAADTTLGKVNMNWAYEAVDGHGGRVVTSPRGAVIIPDTITGIGQHIALNDPATVLADIAADRDLIAAWEEAAAYYRAHTIASAGEVTGLLTAIKIRARRFARHPDWSDAWETRVA